MGNGFGRLCESTPPSSDLSKVSPDLHGRLGKGVSVPTTTELRIAVLFAGLVSAQGCATRGPDLQSDARDLRERSTRIAALEGEKNIDSILTFYDDHAVIQPPGQAPVSGREAIRELYEEFRKIPFVTFKASITTLEVGAGGDLGYETGVNRFEFERGGARTELVGKYLAVWRKKDGQWRIVALSFSDDRPSS
jgi:ketosteroid isomerase-like protein